MLDFVVVCMLNARNVQKPLKANGQSGMSVIQDVTPVDTITLIGRNVDASIGSGPEERLFLISEGVRVKSVLMTPWRKPYEKVD